MNGYARLHPLSMKVRADTLESIAGFEDGERRERELAFAVASVDVDDVDSLRWLAALIDARVLELESLVRGEG